MRLLLRLCLVLVGLEVLYVVASSLYLNSASFRTLIASSPDSMVFEMGQVISYYPGMADVRGFRMGEPGDAKPRKPTSDVWRLEIDSARLHVDLLALFHRTFRATRIDARGVRFSFDEGRRARKPEGEKTGAKSAEQKKDPPKNAWNLAFENLTLDDVTNLSVAGIEFEGNAHAAGTFTLSPGRSFSLFPEVSIAFAPGSRLLGAMGPEKVKKVLVSGLEGHVTARLPVVNFNEPGGAEILKKLAGDLALKARSRPLKVALGSRAHPSSLDIEDSRLEIIGAFAQGRLEKGTRLVVRSPNLGARFYGWGARGSGELSFRVSPDEIHLSEAELVLEKVRVTPPGVTDPKQAIDTKKVEVTLASNPVVLSDVLLGLLGSGSQAPLTGEEARDRLRFESLRAGRIRLAADLDDVSGLNRALGAGRTVSLLRGKGVLEADFLLGDDGFLPGSRASLKSTDLRARLYGHEAHGDGTLSFSVGSETKDDGGPEARLELLFRRFAIFHLPLLTSGVSGHDFKVTVRSRQLDFEHVLDKPQVEVRLPETTVADLAFVSSYLPRGSGVRIAEGTTRVAAVLRSDFTRPGRDSGEVVLTVNRAALTFEPLALRADVAARLVLNSGDLRTGDLNLSGSRVQLTRVSDRATEKAPSQRGGGDEIRDWWADVRLESAQLHANDPVRATTRVVVKLRDVLPALDFFLLRAKTRVPGFLLDAVRFPGLVIHANVRADEKLLLVSDFNADDTRAVFKGWLRRETVPKSHVLAGLLAKYGRMALGLSLQDDDVSVKLMGAEEWFSKDNRRPEAH